MSRSSTINLSTMTRRRSASYDVPDLSNGPTRCVHQTDVSVGHPLNTVRAGSTATIWFPPRTSTLSREHLNNILAVVGTERSHESSDGTAHVLAARDHLCTILHPIPIASELWLSGQTVYDGSATRGCTRSLPFWCARAPIAVRLPVARRPTESWWSRNARPTARSAAKRFDFCETL